MAILLAEVAKLSNDVPRNPPPTWPSRQRPVIAALTHRPPHATPVATPQPSPHVAVAPATRERRPLHNRHSSARGRRPRPQWPYSTCDVRPCASWISSA